MGFKKGHKLWDKLQHPRPMLGRKFTEEHKKKISEARRGKIPNGRLGKKYSEETRKKMSLAQIGKKHTEESKKKMSISKKGKIAWNKGKSLPQLSGKRNHNWKGGITPLNQKIRTNLKYIEWRKAVFRRDNWECVWCGIRGMYLNADHVKPFAVIVQENNIKSMEDALKCKELWEISNGRTLCEPCHKKTDTYLNRWVVEKYIKTGE